MFNHTTNQLFEFLGRILLSALFLGAVTGKIGNYAGTQGYMEAMGVSGSLLPLVIVLQIVAPILLIIGYKARYAALALAGFCILSALLFHFDFADQMQSTMFMKNLALAGGFLFVAARGVSAFSLEKS